MSDQTSTFRLGSLLFALALVLGQSTRGQECELGHIATLYGSDTVLEDDFGLTVAISGNTVLIGAWKDDDLGEDSGSAYVFENVDGTWQETAKLTAADGATGDRFGVHVAISGTTAVIGAYRTDEACPSDINCGSGSAYVFDKVDGAWTQTAKLLADDKQKWDEFGRAVAIRGDAALIGARGEDDVDDSNTGSAYLFQLVDGVWMQMAKLRAADGSNGDNFGVHVAFSEDAIFVAEILDDDLGSNAGAAYVFEKLSGAWTQTAKLTAPDGGPGQFFGNVAPVSNTKALIGTVDGPRVFERLSGTWEQTVTFSAPGGELVSQIAVSEDTAVIGGKTDLHLDPAPGAVFVFEIIDGNWIQTAEHKAPDAAEALAFGRRAVAISGRTAVIAAGPNIEYQSGAVYLYAVGGLDCNANGLADECDVASGSSTDCNANAIPDDCELNRTEELVVNLAAVGNQFGESVAVSGATLLAGARGIGPGHAYVLERVFGVWGTVASLTAIDGQSDDQFGCSVAIEQDTAVVGACGDDDAGNAAGSVYLFENTLGEWTQVVKLNANDAATGDSFGEAVAIDLDRGLLERDTVVVGARYHDEVGFHSGSAYVFEKIVDEWTQSAKLIPNDGAENDRFGHSVDVSGDLISVGSPFHNADGSDQGAVYLFEDSGAAWTQVAKLTANDGTGNDQFGSAVALDGNRALIGAPNDDELGTAMGSAYIFEIVGGSWTQTAKLKANDGTTGARFGSAVALSGDTAMIGASAHGAGSVYRFRKINGVWRQSMKVNSPDLAVTEFGLSVAIDGSASIIGATSAGTEPGIAYFFDVNFDCDGDNILDTCELANCPPGDLTCQDCNANGTPDGCEATLADPPLEAPVSSHQQNAKARYLSFFPSNIGGQTSIQVSLVASAQFPEAIGATRWVGPPAEFCENGAQVGPPCSPVAGVPSDTFLSASLQCQQNCMDWGSLQETIQIGDAFIVPGAEYEIRAVPCVCGASQMTSSSVPLPVATSIWGDVVEDCADCPCSPPAGAVSILDCKAVLDRFSAAPCSPSKARVDLEPAVPDRQINVTDALACIQAFQGLEYNLSVPVGCE